MTKRIEEGAIRYNTDSNKMEVWIGDKWMIVATSSPNLDGGSRAIWVSGNSGTDIIDYVTISTQGNAIDFGDLTAATSNMNGCTSNQTAAAMHRTGDTIETVTIASTGNATDFGDTLSSRAAASSQSDSHGGLTE